MQTIFSNIVRNENDYTYLLCNLMQRHPRVAAITVSHLIGRDLAEHEITSLVFHTQALFIGENGREVPDLLIERPGFRCVVEAKVDPALRLSDAQANGYKACLVNAGERHLCYLVPNEWRHGVDVISMGRELGPDVQVHEVRFWRNLVSLLIETAKDLDDEVLREAVNFLKERFEIVQWTDLEHQSLSHWPEAHYSAMRKLQKTVDQVKLLFDARDSVQFKTELEGSETDGYGFYLKCGREYVLWIGMWSIAPTPLAFGFSSNRAGWWKPKDAIQSPIVVGDRDRYSLWSLVDSASLEPERIYTQIKSWLLAHHVADDENA